MFMLQREVFALTLLLPAFAVLLTRGHAASAALCGVAFALAASIKPTLLVGMPAVVVWLWVRHPERARRSITLLLAASAATMAMVAGLMAWMGILGGFLEMARNYWPMYAAIDDGAIGGGIADHVTRLFGILTSAHVQWMAPALVGAWISWQSADEVVRDRLALLLLLMAAFLVYPLLGHGRHHEWLPFIYFAIMLAVTPLRPLQGSGGVSLAKAMAFLLLVVVTGQLAWLPDRLVRQMAVGDARSPSRKAVLELGERARAHGPEAHAQLLEWMDGGATALLAAGIPPATAFVYDLPFYHHTSTPYVRGLRDRFIDEISAELPPLIIRRNASGQPIVAGPGTNEPFRRVDALLSHYEICYRTDDLLLYHRRGVDWHSDAETSRAR
jgi:hypothetical protein